MSSKRIPVREAARAWLEDPEFRAEYEALKEEFALASALIEARRQAGMTQAQVAKATQAVIARLEGGQVRPSTRTLERFAKATGTRLRIRFEPGPSRRDPTLPEVCAGTTASRRPNRAEKVPGSIAL
jgi:ribosome-binding protein aMBF1 (putative translation factor)